MEITAKLTVQTILCEEILSLLGNELYCIVVILRTLSIVLLSPLCFFFSLPPHLSIFLYLFLKVLFEAMRGAEKVTAFVAAFYYKIKRFP